MEQIQRVTLEESVMKIAVAFESIAESLEKIAMPTKEAENKTATRANYDSFKNWFDEQSKIVEQNKKMAQASDRLSYLQRHTC